MYKYLRSRKFDAGALFVFTLVILAAFAGSGGHKAVEEKGVKDAAKTAWEQRVDNVSTQEKYKATVND